MVRLDEITAKGTSVRAAQGWQRVVADKVTWNAASEGLAAGDLTLVGLWADGESVHMALADWAKAEMAILSLRTRGRSLPLRRQGSSAGDPA